MPVAFKHFRLNDNVQTLTLPRNLIHIKVGYTPPTLTSSLIRPIIPTMDLAQPTNTQKLRIIACGAIAREITAICQLNRLDHIDLQCLPAIWHVYPEKIAPGLRMEITKARAEGFERIFIGYAECGTRGEIDKICLEEGIERIEGPHCYAFFSGNKAFEQITEHEFTAFYLTDLLARQFESFVIEPLKLDKHREMRDLVFGNYTKIVYLAQSIDEALVTKAKWAADYLKLDYEYRFTGYGDLTNAIIRT